MNDKIYITADEIENTNCDKESQETVISFERDSDRLIINSSDNTFLTKMKSIMQRDPVSYKCYYYAGNKDKVTGKVSNYVFETDKKLLTFRVASSKKELTDEEKEAFKQRMNKAKE